MLTTLDSIVVALLQIRQPRAHSTSQGRNPYTQSACVVHADHPYSALLLHYCRSVNLERIAQVKGEEVKEELCEKDPQLPQGFTPLKTDIVIKPGDTLKATCLFDSTSVKKSVKAGATHNDEMCNLYLMLYSQLPYFMACYGSPQVEKHGMGGIPLEGRVEVRLPSPGWEAF